MRETKQATVHRRRSSRVLTASAAAAAVVVGLLVVAIVAPRSGHNAAAGFDAPAPATGSHAIVPTEASASPTATPSATAASSPSPTPTPAPPTAVSNATSPSASPRVIVGTAPVARSGAARLAGRIQPGVTYQGVATEYAAADGNGACLFGPAADMMIAAMNETDYESAKACGDHILVRAANGATITVLITNECHCPVPPASST